VFISYFKINEGYSLFTNYFYFLVAHLKKKRKGKKVEVKPTFLSMKNIEITKEKKNQSIAFYLSKTYDQFNYLLDC